MVTSNIHFTSMQFLLLNMQCDIIFLIHEMINVVRRSNQLKSQSNTHLVTKRGGIKNTFPAVQLFQRFLIA